MVGASFSNDQNNREKRCVCSMQFWNASPRFDEIPLFSWKVKMHAHIHYIPLQRLSNKIPSKKVQQCVENTFLHRELRRKSVSIHEKYRFVSGDNACLNGKPQCDHEGSGWELHFSWDNESTVSRDRPSLRTSDATAKSALYEGVFRCFSENELEPDTYGQRNSECIRTLPKKVQYARIYLQSHSCMRRDTWWAR